MAFQDAIYYRLGDSDVYLIALLSFFSVCLTSLLRGVSLFCISSASVSLIVSSVQQLLSEEFNFYSSIALYLICGHGPCFESVLVACSDELCGFSSGSDTSRSDWPF